MSGIKQRARQAAAGATLKAACKAESMVGDDSALKDVKQAATAKGGQGLTADARAQGANKAVNLVVGLVVAALMAAFLLPIAIDELASVDTTSWGDGAAAMWNILPVIVVLAIFLFMVGLALSRSNI